MGVVDELAAEPSAPDYLPLERLLWGSLYYPASAFDGSVVKTMGKRGIRSFVYADYGYTRQQLEENVQQQPFRGYRVKWSRDVEWCEVREHGWQSLSEQEQFARDARRWNSDRWREGDGSRGWQSVVGPRGHAFVRAEGFARWYLWKRDDDLGDDHGPPSFSLIYVGGDGVATFHALYWNRAAPSVVAIVQPGSGFGGNYTDFREEGKIFHRSVTENPAGVPEKLVYGGWGSLDGYKDSCWKEWSRHLETFTQAQHARNATLWGRKPHRVLSRLQ